MNIADIRPNQKGVELVAEVVEVSPVKEFTKFGKPGKVASALIKDETGTVQLTLWDEQVSMVKQGDRIKLSNCYVKEWQGERQVNLGRQGTLTVL